MAITRDDWLADIQAQAEAQREAAEGMAFRVCYLCGRHRECPAAEPMAICEVCRKMCLSPLGEH